MMELILLAALVLTVVVVGAVALAAWVGVSVLRLVWWVVSSVVGGVWRLIFGRGSAVEGYRKCGRPACGHAAPEEARFCPRCGRAMAGAREVAVGAGAKAWA